MDIISKILTINNRFLTINAYFLVVCFLAVRSSVRASSLHSPLPPPLPFGLVDRVAGEALPPAARMSRERRERHETRG